MAESRMTTGAKPAEPSKADLTEIKSLANPPEGVKTLLSAAFYLLGYPKSIAEDWTKIREKLHMGSFSLLAQDANPAKVNPEKAKELLSGMNANAVANKSAASMSVYKWCLARLAQLG